MFFSSAFASFLVISYLFVSLNHKISTEKRKHKYIKAINCETSTVVYYQRFYYSIELTSLTLILALADVSIKAQLN